MPGKWANAHLAMQQSPSRLQLLSPKLEIQGLGSFVLGFLSRLSPQDPAVIICLYLGEGIHHELVSNYRVQAAVPLPACSVALLISFG